ncbi:Cholesterol oxidase, substrate-binding [Grimontia celer]|uniref:Cholesterol oxidase, substrate-binding n=1 Tax=Grimontia celer TaxID=1796497 RepID=A0A128EZ52_9GAMM|nr:cholesterol oxidase substrate-binding domain-containing protein [Grimontia celer]CZF79545.1 Cholesterol oxidase, substrate-binding [Grimontia celer]
MSFNNERRKFLKNSQGLLFTSVAISSLPMSFLLSGCQSEFYYITYENWSQDIKVKSVMAASAKVKEDLERVAEWALENGYAVKAFGSMHNWSPLIISETEPKDKILLLDVSAFNHLEMVESHQDYGVVRAGSGVQAENLYAFLEAQAGGNPDIPGYAFSNTPAPGNLSLAGMLSIGGHGTKVSYNGSDENETLNGSISNNVLSVTALVWNGSKYTLRTFTRDEEDGDLFLTALGATLIFEVTMLVQPNYNLRCQSFTDIHYAELFASTQEESTFSIANILDTAGRMEVIWFPYSQKPWLKVWSNEAEQPAGSRAVSGPYNYPFSDNIPLFISDIIKGILVAKPFLVPAFGILQSVTTTLALKGGANRENLQNQVVGSATSRSLNSGETITQEEFDELLPYIEAVEETQPDATARSLFAQSYDIWGPAWKTLVYVRNTTLRVTANGYAVHLNRNDVQGFLHDFANVYLRIQAEYAARKQFPMAGPMEIRVTGTDRSEGLNVPGAKPPAFSATTATDDAALDTVVWVDLLTFADMQGAGAFYQEVEEWLYQQLPAEQVRVEWSKGWGYNAQGAWQNDAFISNVLPTTFNTATRSYDETVSKLRSYDPHYLFASSFIRKLVP